MTRGNEQKQNKNKKGSHFYIFNFCVTPWKIIIPFYQPSELFEKAKQSFIAYTFIGLVAICLWWRSSRRTFSLRFYFIETVLCHVHSYSCMFNGFYISYETIFISHLKDINSISFCIKTNFPPPLHVFLSLSRSMTSKGIFSNNVNLVEETLLLVPCHSFSDCW